MSTCTGLPHPQNVSIETLDYTPVRPFVREQMMKAHGAETMEEVRSPKLTVVFSHSSYILMTYRVFGRR